MTMRRYYVRVRACVAREDEDAKFRIDELGGDWGTAD